LLEQSDCDVNGGIVPRHHRIARAEIQLVGRYARRLTLHAFPRESHAELCGDRVNDVILQSENVAKLAVISLRPSRQACGSVDKPHRHAKT
jgi:hypothetical protein